MVAAATELNAEARRDRAATPTSSSATCSAPPSAAPTAPSGIHAELVRRLTAAARYSPDNQPLPAAFLERLPEGFDAGVGTTG